MEAVGYTSSVASRATFPSRGRLSVNIFILCAKFLFANSYLKPIVLFSFGEGGAKEKRTKKERRRKGISLVATSDKGYAPLDLRKLLKKFDKTFLVWVRCEHAAKH